MAQYLALRAVADRAQTGGDLARRTGVSAAAASQLVAAVERAGWVERTVDPKDRRSNSLTLSEAGRLVLASAGALLDERLGPVLAELHPPERGALVVLERALTGTAPPRRPRPPRPREPRGPRP